MGRHGYLYVDIRSEDDFDEGRPAGAINVPFVPEHVTEFVAAIAARCERNAKLIVGCNSGKRSSRAAEALVRAGFVDVVDQRAGWDGSRGPFGELREPGWRRLGLPTERGSQTRS